MKLLESTALEALNSALSFETGQYKIIGRVESYSCKMAGSDKRLYKTMTSESGTDPHQLQTLSPPQSTTSCYSMSPTKGGGIYRYLYIYIYVYQFITLYY